MKLGEEMQYQLPKAQTSMFYIVLQIYDKTLINTIHAGFHNNKCQSPTVKKQSKFWNLKKKYGTKCIDINNNQALDPIWGRL